MGINERYEKNARKKKRKSGKQNGYKKIQAKMIK